MDAQQLIDRLEERAAEVPVGPPPIDLMRAGARRRRRQGRVAVLAAAAAVAVIAGGVAWQGSGDDGSRPPVASEGPGDFDSLPTGYRYVGAGDVVAAVPQGWSRNETECGTPMRDTVVLDQGVICRAAVPRPADVDSLTVLSGSDPGDTQDWDSIEVAGEPALRSQITDHDGTVVQSLLVSGGLVMFVAESSSPDGAEVVDAILDSVTILRDHTTVPGFQDLAFQQGGTSMVEAYVDRLEAAGLRAEVTRGNGGGLDRDTVLDVSPAVGLVVEPGDVVHVVAAR